jgi:two-component system response regulator PilR (NtrC family)
MSSPRILVVDDEADLRELLEITLLKMGLDVDSAATLREARGLGNTEYALVLTDMRLPDGLGLELVREVRRTKNTPIAVVTAFGSAENAVVALKAGAFDYVSKPVVLDELRTMVRRRCAVRSGAAAGRAAPRGRAVAPDRRLAGDAGAARPDRAAGALDGADRHQRRIGQRQGTGRARNPRPELARPASPSSR